MGIALSGSVGSKVAPAALKRRCQGVKLLGQIFREQGAYRVQGRARRGNSLDFLLQSMGVQKDGTAAPVPSGAGAATAAAPAPAPSAPPPAPLNEDDTANGPQPF